MLENCIAIVMTMETIFFSYESGKLRQWITVTIENHSNQPVQGEVSIEAGGERATTQLFIAPGVQEYRCHAPVLWPKHPPISDAHVRLTVGEDVSTSTTSVGSHRPWKVYLLSDVCTDYTWVYSDEESLRSDDAELTEAELALAEATQHAPESDRNHYNFVHAREVEFYVERYPDRAERLFDHIRQGNITLNPIFNMAMTCAMSQEELIRQLYPARAWAMKHGLDMGYANHQETPTITWGFVPILVGSGIEHLVKSILPYECPWVKRLEEPPIFVWEGPDGSRILVRRRNENYTEGSFALKNLQATNASVHDAIIPDYENLGERYPFDAVGLVGCYGDLSANSRTLPAKKAATIAAYNAQDWEYPKLINASHKQFWDDIDSQIAERHVEVPTYRGDYGASWDAWPASLAYDAAAWRRAQERAGAADKLAAILSFLSQDLGSEMLSQGWMNLTYLADHAWNGANDSNRALNVDEVRIYVYSDNLAARKLLGQQGFRHTGVDVVLAEVDLTKELPVKDIDTPATIRMLDEGDAAKLVEFCQEAEDEDTAIIQASTAEEALEYIRDEDAEVNLVAELDGKIVGCFGAEKHTGHLGLNIHSGYRKRGIGSALMYGLLRILQERGYTNALTDSEDTRIPAHALYRKFGFQEMRRRECWAEALQ